MRNKIKKTQTLLAALQEMYPDSSKSTLRSLLKEERVRVNEVVCKIASVLLEAGQTIEVIKKNKHMQIEGDIEILYQDPYLAVINKPTGLLSVSTDFEKDLTAHKILKKHFYPKKVEVVHRLDKDTSGVMVFALDPKTQESLKTLFEKHRINRQYTAILEGKLAQSEGTWNSYLFEDSNYFVHSTNHSKKGQLATTHYKVAGYSKKYTRVNFTLETGKKNQIRVHSKDAGHPVAGDIKYGATSNPAKRLMLHAFHLSFVHPVKHQNMQFTAQPPESFNKIVPIRENRK